jgi:hypothetical protein
MIERKVNQALPADPFMVKIDFEQQLAMVVLSKRASLAMAPALQVHDACR